MVLVILPYFDVINVKAYAKFYVNIFTRFSDKNTIIKIAAAQVTKDL